MRKVVAKLIAASSFMAWAGCKVDDGSKLNGLGGTPKDYNCFELQTEYTKLRGELGVAIEKFSAAVKSMVSANTGDGGADGSKDLVASNSATDANSNTDGGSGSTENALALGDAANLDRRIGEGEFAPQELPAEMSAMAKVVDCDEKYGAERLKAASQVLFLCHEIMQKRLDMIAIKTEHNERAECRAGKADSQRKQASDSFGYCRTKCPFAPNSNCSKCSFSYGALGANLVPSSYICESENDTRVAIDDFCKSGNFSCSEVKCETPKPYGEDAFGTTGTKTDQKSIKVEHTVYAKVEAEFNELANVKVAGDVGFKASVQGTIEYKNAQGGPIENAGVGDTNTTFKCRMTMEGVGYASGDVSAGAGFDIVIAKGKAVAGLKEQVELKEVIIDESRDIPASGQSEVQRAAACVLYTKNWLTRQLPAILAEKLKFRAVAKVFMGAERAQQEKNVKNDKIFCNTSISSTFSSGNKIYRINKIFLSLKENSIEVKVNYEGSLNPVTSDSATAGLTAQHLGRDYYVELRKRIFEGVVENVTTDDVRKVSHWTWDKFTDCDGTSY